MTAVWSFSGSFAKAFGISTSHKISSFFRTAMYLLDIVFIFSASGQENVGLFGYPAFILQNVSIRFPFYVATVLDVSLVSDYFEPRLYIVFKIPALQPTKAPTGIEPVFPRPAELVSSPF